MTSSILAQKPSLYTWYKDVELHGNKIHEYKLDKIIGRGGSSQVWLATKEINTVNEKNRMKTSKKTTQLARKTQPIQLYQALDSENNQDKENPSQVVAIKEIKLSWVEQYANQEGKKRFELLTLQKEIKILLNIRNGPHVAKILDWFADPVQELGYIVLEYIPHYPIAAFRIDDEMANNPSFKAFIDVRFIQLL